MAYLGKTPSQAVRSRYYFTASGGETSLSGADDNTNTLTFTDGNYVDVSLNGVALVAGTDYNTTTANTIGGLTALVASDVVEVIVYDTFSVFGGEFRGDISLGDNVKAKFGASDDLQIYHDASDSIINDNGTGSLKLQTGGSTKLEVTSTGIDVTGTVTADGLTSVLSGDTQGKFSGWSVVGANTASGAIELGQTPAYQGVISYAADGSTRFIFDNTYGSTASTFEFRSNTSATPKTHMKITGGGDISFYEDTGTTAKFFWDASAESLGIGTSSPSAALDTYGIIKTTNTTDNSYYGTFSNPDGLTRIQTFGGGSSIAMSTGGTERMRIDSSGNVGIGTTSPATNLHIKSSGDTQLWLDSSATSVSNRIVSLGQNGGAYKDLRYDAGQHLFRIGTTERMRIDSSGKVLINTTSTIYGEYLRVNSATSYTIHSSRNTTGTDGHVVFSNANGAVGSITTSGSSTAYVTSSDHRLKENVTDVTDGITRVKQLEPKRFNFIVDPDTTVDGFLAHEAQTVVPEAVTGTHNEVDADGNPVYQGIDQSKLVPLLTAALKEAITKIETLETEMTSVKARLDALEAN